MYVQTEPPFLKSKKKTEVCPKVVIFTHTDRYEQMLCAICALETVQQCVMMDTSQTQQTPYWWRSGSGMMALPW